MEPALLKMNNLFSQNLSTTRPLADRVRPQRLAEFIGQEKIIGPGTLLRQAAAKKQIPSLIFWGPPGSGKTTLARILAQESGYCFKQLSAVASGLKDLRQILTQAQNRLELHQERTLLFIDEIHRWNKAQQDSLLPYIENGLITLIGATTENPSFEVISPLLSRTRVFVLEKHTAQDVEKILNRAWKQEFKKRPKENIHQTIKYLAKLAEGDARIALNALEFAYRTAGNKISQNTILQALQKTGLLYDKDGEEHYNIISALHKSMRGNDANAALYWLGRMLEAGEDPLYIARRLIRFASEDIGLADPQALPQAIAVYQAAHFIGLPECNVNLAQAVVYLAQAPKSNLLYTAYSQVQQDLKNLPTYPVPLHLRNAPTKLMKNLGYGQGYKYNPDFKKEVKQNYLPQELAARKYLKNQDWT